MGAYGAGTIKMTVPLEQIEKHVSLIDPDCCIVLFGFVTTLPIHLFFRRAPAQDLVNAGLHRFLVETTDYEATETSTLEDIS